ncbi:MAG: hypothetical protein L0Y58_12995 [Verrucomicrobia subdivision 3 bacterium]|nr:hypothetical protein [Limisphaerales bacterium]
MQAGKFINSGYAEGEAFVNVVAGASAPVTVVLKDPPEIYRRLVIRGTMSIEDYENFGDNEYATRNFARNSDLGPWDTHDEVGWTEKMGGEIRVVVSLKIDLHASLSIKVDWHVAFYEGTSEETGDLDGQRSGTITVGKDETKPLSISVWNTDEDEPEDRADISFDLTNKMRP